MRKYYVYGNDAEGNFQPIQRLKESTCLKLIMNNCSSDDTCFKIEKNNKVEVFCVGEWQKNKTSHNEMINFLNEKIKSSLRNGSVVKIYKKDSIYHIRVRK